MTAQQQQYGAGSQLCQCQTGWAHVDISAQTANGQMLGTVQYWYGTFDSRVADAELGYVLVWSGTGYGIDDMYCPRGGSPTSAFRLTNHITYCH